MECECFIYNNPKSFSSVTVASEVLSIVYSDFAFLDARYILKVYILKLVQFIAVANNNCIHVNKGEI